MRRKGWYSVTRKSPAGLQDPDCLPVVRPKVRHPHRNVSSGVDDVERCIGELAELRDVGTNEVHGELERRRPLTRYVELLLGDVDGRHLGSLAR